MNDLKTHSELVEDIKKSFLNSVEQIENWDTPDGWHALESLKLSFTGILDRAIKRLKDEGA